MDELTNMNTPESISKGEIVLYQPDSSIRLEVRLENETVWLNRHQMATLFDRDVKTIGKHINNALSEELQGFPTVAKFATVQLEGDRMVERDIEYYNLDAILSVGYRVKSKSGIKFRQWANRVLKEYLLKGYAINQRIEQVERFAIEAGQKAIEVNKRIDLLIRDIEDVLKVQNDINEDTRMQLELINTSLAELQGKHKGLLTDNSRIRVGFTAPQYREKNKD